MKCFYTTRMTTLKPTICLSHPLPPITHSSLSTRRDVHRHLCASNSSTMAITFSPRITAELVLLTHEFDMELEAVTADLVFDWAYMHDEDEPLPCHMVVDMLSLLYGIHENRAVYGETAYVRRTGANMMKHFDDAVNYLDKENDDPVLSTKTYVHRLKQHETLFVQTGLKD